MSDAPSNPLQDARQLVTELRHSADSVLKQQLDTLDQMLAAAQRRGEGQEASALRDQIEDLVGMNAKFISVMVHEIRVPMTSIKGYSDMLGKNVVGPLNDQQQQFVETIRSNVTRMEHLVTDISDISKIQSGRIRLEPQMEMYKNIAMKIEKNLADLAAEHGHRLTFDTPSGLPLLNTDSARLTQVLEKLAINALRYTPEGGEVAIRAENADGRLKVSVIDTGIGMTEEEQTHIGELFWRAEDEHVRSFKGHGLGLPIAIGLIKLMGGEFFYESRRGQGSVFGFVVPGMS